MALLEVNWNPDRRELRQFAILWVTFFALFGAYCQWLIGAPLAATLLWGVAAIGVGGYFRPDILRPAYIVWMALALPIGWTTSHLLLICVYYLVLTPIALLMRLFGYDPMQRELDRSANSYWMPHDPGADRSRYLKQF
jgi:hypothetical protein